VGAILPTANTAYTIAFASFSRADVVFNTHKLFSFGQHGYIFDVCVGISTQTFLFDVEVLTTWPHFRRIRFFFTRISCFVWEQRVTFSMYALLFLRKQFFLMSQFWRHGHILDVFVFSLHASAVLFWTTWPYFRCMRCYFYANVCFSRKRFDDMVTFLTYSFVFHTHKLYSFWRHGHIFDVCVVISTQTIFFDV
jgi:hypothetical protein